MANATIKDVAALAGVSKSTVSLVLQNSPLVKAATRQSVQRAMAQLGYVYNAAAAGLRGNSLPAPTINAVFLSCDLGDPASSPFVAALQSEAAARGLGLHLLQKGAAAMARKITTLPSLADEAGTLFALHPNAAARIMDGMGAQTATRHLLGLGSAAVALIGGDTAQPVYAQRQRGYFQRMQQAGLTPRHLAGGDDFSFGRAAIDQLLDQTPSCTAALCISDQVALGVMAGLAARGIALGDGFRVVGWGDTPAAAEAGLTSLRPDYAALAKVCVDWVQHGGEKSHEIEPKLIRRQSSQGGLL